MQLTLQVAPLSDPYSGINLFADLLQHTILALKQLISITKLLLSNKM